MAGGGGGGGGGGILVSTCSSQVSQDSEGFSCVQGCQFLGNLGILQNPVSENQEAKTIFGNIQSQKVSRRISRQSFQPQSLL